MSQTLDRAHPHYDDVDVAECCGCACAWCGCDGRRSAPALEEADEDGAVVLLVSEGDGAVAC